MGDDSALNRRAKSKKKVVPSILKTKPVRPSRQTNRSEQFKSKFHLNLIEKKDQLERTIDALIKSNNEDFSKISFDGTNDELDRADRERAAQNYYHFLDRKKSELNKINALLRRIEKDEDFGICEDCGRKIPEARLMIIPEAVLCVPCQEEFEEYESRAHHSSSSHKAADYREGYSTDDSSEDMDDAGVTKSGTESISFMDMDEIDLTDLPDIQGDDSKNNNTSQ